jgi:5-methylcytosine-specific restriction endonuclease McrA
MLFLIGFILNHYRTHRCFLTPVLKIATIGFSMAKLNAMSLRILELMKQHPEGISEGEIREALQIPPAEQSNFGRRRRELNSHYFIEKRQEGAKVLYIYKGTRDQPRDILPINQRLRAQALHSAQGRCANCGRTIEKHGIVLVVDHKIPRDWGGLTEPDNLWAICEDCNAGKKNYFASVDTEWMREVMGNKSVHVRLGETLKALQPAAVPASTMSFVAGQDDWKKRARELRYLGWNIHVFNRTLPEGKVSSFYQLLHWEPWPEDPTNVIRRFERERAVRNKHK